VPKKKAKTVQNKNQKSLTATRKSAPAVRKKTGAKVPAVKKSKPGLSAEASDEAIRMRAYFISERRHRLALPGDSNSDWLEAKRQLDYERR